jgi:hypothetical protein
VFTELFLKEESSCLPLFRRLVPDRETGTCLDPEVPGTGLPKEGNAGPGPPYSGKKSQLEPSRDGENMRKEREEPILDVMKEDQQPTE